PAGSEAFALVNGNPLRYRLDGDGLLVVFGHGLMGRIEQVDEYLAGLDPILSRIRLLAYDARGHGLSGGPEAPNAYSWETLGRDMGELIRFAGDEQAIVGGVSMGAAA